MKISHLKINRLTNPIGYDFETVTASYIVEDTDAKKQTKAQIQAALDDDFTELVYDSGESSDIVSTGHELDFSLEAETRYFWRVEAWNEKGEHAVSETAWFETGKEKEWKADWITPDLPKEVQTVLEKKITVKKPVCRARMYMVGLGLYEFYLDGEKQGKECLLPGFCDYDTWIQYQTFELKLEPGEHELQIVLGDGWYKGWYGLNQTSENYGDRLAAIAELHIIYENGETEMICTDCSWTARKSKIVYSGIYPGEIYDATLDDSEIFSVKYIELDKTKLCPRLSPAITIHEKLTPVEIIHTPAGETVLDMGQNMVGWFSFRNRAPKGKKLYFQFGEILQDGNFYNENLRTAKAEYTFISDGIEREVTQHFTFYGYRFVNVVGWEGEIDVRDFKGLVIHSEMEELGTIETSDPLVNRLILNAKWGQKGNFLDVPTDCPQRDERYGWTGDAQIFSGTACFNMDTYAFYTKYGKDVYAEQKKLGGSVPDVVPVANYPGDGSTAWGDAATIIPWNTYLHFGDKGILRRQYDSMKAWVDYMRQQDKKYGNQYLWQSGGHYADWLALDGNYEGGVYGATDPFLICSGYYYYSTQIVAKTAGILGKKEDQEYYTDLAEKIRQAFIHRYFTPSGLLAVNTMTAHVVALYMGLTPEFAYEETCKGLFNQLRRNHFHLNTGFVGTPYLCPVLSQNGMNDLAYTLLLEKGYPGWLYEVLMGATTIWERWNSVLPNGKISGTGMNSLNHYSYGSIVEWMYRYMCGIQPDWEHPGFKRFTIAPTPNYQLQWAKASLHSASGLIRSEWKIEGEKLHFEMEVPFDTQALLVLPDADYETLKETLKNTEGVESAHQAGKNVEVIVCAGSYSFTYEPTVPYRRIYHIDLPMTEIKANEKALQILQEEYYPHINGVPFEGELFTLREVMNGPFTFVDYEIQNKIDQKLRMINS